MIKYIDVHHTGPTATNPKASTQHQTAEQINEYHRQKWNFKSSLGFYGGYNLFIDKEGNLTQFRAIGEECAHTYGHNLDTIGICLAGNFTKGVDQPTEAQKHRLGEVLHSILNWQDLGLPLQYKTTSDVVSMVGEKDIVPHRALSQTTCHGDGLQDSFGRDCLRAFRDKYIQKRDIFQIIYDQLQDIYAKLLALLKEKSVGEVNGKECDGFIN